MYSKCIVEPLIKHPIAIAAVKGPVDAPEAGAEVVVGVPEAASLLRRLTRFVVEAFNKDGAELEDWTWAPAISLKETKGRSANDTDLPAFRPGLTAL